MQRGLVGKITRNTTLVLHACTTNESRVEDETVLGSLRRSLATRLKGTEKSLLCTKNLNSGGRILGKIGQTAGVRNQTGTNSFTNKRRQVRSDSVHLLDEISLKVTLVLSKLDDTLSKVHDAFEIEVRDLVTHGSLAGLDDLRNDILRVFTKDLTKTFSCALRIVHDGLLLADGHHAASVGVVVGDDCDELGEVPGVPLTSTHGESVDILIELIEEADTLNDHVITLVDVEFDLRTTVAVSKRTLSLIKIVRLHSFDELCEMKTNATLNFCDKL